MATDADMRAIAPDIDAQDRLDEHHEFEREFLISDTDHHVRSAVADTAAAAPGFSFDALKAEYAHLWAEMAIRRERLAEIDTIVDRIVRNKDRYLKVEQQTGVPWFAVGTIHNLEASGNFTKHLHNGDPLTARTVHVPPGRPATGNPPFTWEESAVDALTLHELNRVAKWTIERLAYEFERYNGFGYRQYHPEVKSPYVWSFSNLYTSGKYVADGRWSPTAVSAQCGAMVLVKRLHDNGQIELTLESGSVPPVDEDTFMRDPDTNDVAHAPQPVDTQLTDGPGIFGYCSGDKRWGTASTIAALREIGRIWQLRHPAPRVGVGDISLKGGGDIEGHASHETGRDADLRPMRNDGTEGPVTWRDASYSRTLTQELIDLLYANGVVRVKVLGFNDPGVQGCVNWVNHDNHLHVRFFFGDEAPGYPVVQLGVDNSPPVREFQRRLNTWKQQHGDTDLLAADGDFGQKTLQAVRAFQTAANLTVDGKVGDATWRQSLDYVAPAADIPVPVSLPVTLASITTLETRPLLERGSVGDAVGTLQAMLRTLHYDIAVDRDFGPATELAVKMFQREHALRADGVVGPDTWAALDLATATGSTQPTRYWPVGRGHQITSPFGPRPGGFHTGTDFGFPGGSAGKPVYAVQSGTVKYSGGAQGYGGPDPAGWLVILSTPAEGTGCVEYGHIVREVAQGEHVTAGQRIAHINPSMQTNGGVPPHLHLSVMPRDYDPRTKMDPIPWLGDALSPEPGPMT